jgi:putative ABC transport system permease protein
VEAASTTSALPMRQFDGSGSPFLIQGRPVPDPGHDTLTDSRLVEPDYFHTMQITLLRGRIFTAQDDDSHPLVAVINATMARRYFPDTDPIGHQIQLVNMRPSDRWFTVIGTVADSRDRGLGRETRCTVYVSDLQNIVRGTVLLIRTKAEPLAMGGTVRSALRSLNRDLFIGEANTLDGVLATSLAPQRFSVTLLTLFATLALSLASIGVYGVTAYTVAQRTREIGIRIALGAQARDVLRLILGQGAGLALAGIALGLAGAMALTRMMTTLLFGVNARDPLTLVVVSGVLAAVALLACYIPARAAMRVDPMVSLRSE